ncbi:MAG: hypothetical protein J5622_05195 [Firmicutes bacterium]|nr:hypothetical protein [Bacillota bacterium]
MGSGRKAWILIEGKTFREIAKASGVQEATLRARYRPGITIRELVNGTKRGKTQKDFLAVGDMTLSEIAEYAGLSYHTVYWRYRNGFDTYAELTARPHELRGKKEKEKK